MSISVIGRRYAKALFSLATEQGKVQEVAKGLSDFVDAYEESRELRSVFENPAFGAERRRAILADIAHAAILPELLVKTLHMLADRGRMRHVGEVSEAFQALLETSSGRVHAEITTATQLGEAYFTELQRTLQHVTGKEVTLSRKIDPSLLGGVVTRIGDQVFDGSLRHRLATLKDELLR